MPGIAIEVRLSGVDQLSNQLSAAPDQVHERLSATMTDALNDLANAIKDSASGQALNVRSGTLVRSVQPRGVSDEGNALVGTISSEGVPYANIQEYGGTITPKNVTFLTIPLDAMVTQTGSRGTAREVIESPESFGYTGTFFAKNILFGKLGKNQIEPLFALKSSVTLPARNWFSEPVRNFEDEFRSRMQDSLAQALADLGSAEG